MGGGGLISPDLHAADAELDRGGLRSRFQGPGPGGRPEVHHRGLLRAGRPLPGSPHILGSGHCWRRGSRHLGCGAGTQDRGWGSGIGGGEGGRRPAPRGRGPAPLVPGRVTPPLLRGRRSPIRPFPPHPGRPTGNRAQDGGRVGNSAAIFRRPPGTLAGRGDQGGHLSPRTAPCVLPLPQNPRGPGGETLPRHGPHSPRGGRRSGSPAPPGRHRGRPGLPCLPGRRLQRTHRRPLSRGSLLDLPLGGKALPPLLGQTGGARLFEP